MATSIHEELRDLSAGQRTLFRVLKQRFGVRLGLTDADILYIVRRTFIPPPYKVGKIILRSGDYLDHFTMLAAGTVKATCRNGAGKSVIVQLITDGHAFGLPSLARAWEARRFGATAHTESLIGLLTPDSLRDIIGRLDTARRVRMLTQGWRANIGLLLEKRLLRALTVKDRLWFMLGRLALRFPAGSSQTGRIRVPLTQAEIGELVGSTRSTVNRKLKEFARDVISGRHRHYTVHRQPPFAAIPGFAESVPIGGARVHDDLEVKELVARVRQQLTAIGLPRPAVDAFVQHARLVRCQPGSQVGQGDTTDALSLLITGAARVECPGPAGEPLPLLVAKPGWLILGGRPAQGRVGFRAIAHVESCAAVLSLDGLAYVVASMTAAEFLRFLSFGWRVLSHHTWAACQSLVTNQRTRILQLLSQLAADFPLTHDHGTMINLPLTVADVAGLVAGTEATVRADLGRLERSRQIGFSGGSERRIVVVGYYPSPRAA